MISGPIYLPPKEWKKMLLRITRTVIIESKRKYKDHLTTLSDNRHVTNHYIHISYCHLIISSIFCLSLVLLQNMPILPYHIACHV